MSGCTQGIGEVRHGDGIYLLKRPEDVIASLAAAYACLSAAADFTVSQVVDRTVGVHGRIYKAHFAG